METIVCCGNWGIGINTSPNRRAVSYGYPESDNPHDFYPDFECCTIDEITAWENAKIGWDKRDRMIEE